MDSNLHEDVEFGSILRDVKNMQGVSFDVDSFIRHMNQN